jgi:hypothetical protein
MSGGIFVSYRRDDSRHAAGRLLDRLRQIYKPHQLFMDVDNIAPGLDFLKALSEQVAACDVMLVIIGPNWLDARDDKGNRRLDDSNDFVRIEVETALRRDVRVIPVLVDGASIPSKDGLPEPLQPLARRQSVPLAHERFGSDADELVRSLRGVVRPAGNKWWGGTGGAHVGARGRTPNAESAAIADRGSRRVDASGGRTGASGKPRVWTAVGIGVVGLVPGFAMFAGWYYLSFEKALINDLTWYMRQTLGIWGGFIAYDVVFVVIWFSLMALLARGAPASALRREVCASTCAAAWFTLAHLAQLLYDFFDLPPLSVMIAIWGAAIAGYALTIRLYLWKAIPDGSDHVQR